jgi:hypothetical protein
MDSTSRQHAGENAPAAWDVRRGVAAVRIRRDRFPAKGQRTVHAFGRGPGDQRGLTLVEGVIYLALTIIITIPMIVVTLGISRSSSEGSTLVRVQERNRSAFTKVLDEIRYSIRGMAVVSGTGKVLRFTKQKGYDGVGPIPGSTITYEMRLSAGEIQNGADDDGDGLVDEGSLVRLDSAVAGEAVVVDTLDCSASSFATHGNQVAVTLTSAGAVLGRRTTGSVLLSATVTPLNRFY